MFLHSCSVFGTNSFDEESITTRNGVFYEVVTGNFLFKRTYLPFSANSFQVGDLLNFLSAVFFGVHMLRTEHISRSTSRDNFLPLLGYEVV